MNLIKTYKDCLSKNMCNKIIEIFENNEKKTEGKTFIGVDKNIKDTTDLHSNNLNDHHEWKIMETIIRKELNCKLDNYYFDINNGDYSNPLFVPYPYTEDSGFQIQKYNQNEGFYKFHNDFHLIEDKFRTLTYLYYLNDVIDGGETEFYNGLKIKPEQGKLLLFPSLWTYTHKGNIPISNDKYILTGWIYSKK